MITTRTNLLTADALAEALGDKFFEDRYTQGAPIDGAVEFFWRYMQAGPIASGTTEMLQRHPLADDVPRRAHTGHRGRGRNARRLRQGDEGRG